MQKIIDFYNVDRVMFNEDWFIVVDKTYNITSCIVSKDPRAEKEYNEYFELAKEYCSFNNPYGNDDSMKK